MPSHAQELTDVSSHFDFGRNWADYSQTIDQDRIDLATESLARLVPDLQGKSFLDVGSGSGLFSLAALRLGASAVLAIDIDPNSVETTRRVLRSFSPNRSWTVSCESVFDLSPEKLGQFDVVYSWGVLHHTGHMWRAVRCAAHMVASSGIFAFALYEKTPLCGAWRLEKHIYMRAPSGVQRLVRAAYTFLHRTALFVSGRRKVAVDRRGMNFGQDLHDWLGGYPYESASGGEVRKHLETLGFVLIQERAVKVHLAGLFGTGCSEYVYRENSSGNVSATL